MSRKRVIFQSLAAFVGPSPSTGYMFEVDGTGVPSDVLADVTGFLGDETVVQGDIANKITQLHRVQSWNPSFNISREDINQFGQLAAIDQVINAAPEVSVDLSYYVTNVNNEQALGLTVNQNVSALSGILAGVENDKNYFLLVASEGDDAAGNTNPTGKGVIAIGNGFLSSYSVEASVNGFPTATARIEGTNVRMAASHTNVQTPAVNPQNGTDISGIFFSIPTATTGAAGQVAALRAGEITVEVGEAGFGVADLNGNIQSFTMSFELSREPIDALGNIFSKSQEIRFPASASMSIEANLTDLKADSLSSILCDDKKYDITVTMRKPSCDGSLGDTAVQYQLKGGKFNSQSLSTAIGSNGRVSLEFSAPIGGPQDLANGIFITGILN